MTDILGSNEQSGAYATERAAGYRRGFVLGLTLAESALLLIFVILLLLLIGFERRNSEIRRLASAADLILKNALPSESPNQTAVRIGVDLSQFAEIKEAAAASGAELSDDFLELVKIVARDYESIGDASLAEKLKEERARLARATEIAERIYDSESLEATLKRMAELEDLTKNQGGQVLELRDRLARTGLGGDLPSCWTTSEGKPGYILEIVLESGGIRASDAISEGRAAERERLPIGRFNPAEVLSESEFLAATRPLFDWSVANECRFYVDVFDATAAHEKALYKSRMRAVEGHFYKRQRNDTATF